MPDRLLPVRGPAIDSPSSTRVRGRQLETMSVGAWEIWKPGQSGVWQAPGLKSRRRARRGPPQQPVGARRCVGARASVRLPAKQTDPEYARRVPGAAWLCAVVLSGRCPGASRCPPATRPMRPHPSRPCCAYTRRRRLGAVGRYGGAVPIAPRLRPEGLHPRNRAVRRLPCGRVSSAIAARRERRPRSPARE